MKPDSVINLPWAPAIETGFFAIGASGMGSLFNLPFLWALAPLSMGAMALRLRQEENGAWVAFAVIGALPSTVALVARIWLRSMGQPPANLLLATVPIWGVLIASCVLSPNATPAARVGWLGIACLLLANCLIP